ncbi:MAG TPA: hypothetical protein VK921_03025 [Anditalea sp.]|nr:hypothetical protein [Anditalea sp.]
MDNTVKNNIEAHGFSFKEAIKGNVFIITKGNQKYIYKTSEKQWEIFSERFISILNKIGVNQLNFRNEISIHKHLSGKSFKYLKLPHIHHTDGRTFMIMDYIEGTMGRWYAPDMDAILVKALADLQLSIQNKKVSLIKKIITMQRRPFWNVLRTIFTIGLPKGGLKLAADCLILCLKLDFKVPSNKNYFLLHKDINNKGNVITDENRTLYFIDFESCVEESKWIFSDIIEVIYSSKDLYMDVELFNIYLNELKKREFITDNFDVKSQVRFAMLRNGIKYLGFKNKAKEHRDQLANIILSDSNFDQWYNQTFLQSNVPTI